MRPARNRRALCRVGVPGFPLDGIGANGCSAHTNANIGLVLPPVVGSSATYMQPIPNNPSLLDAQLTVQASAASTATTVGFATSNGVTGTLGY